MTRDPDQTSMPSPDPARYDGSVPEPAYRTPHAEHRLREHPLDFDRFHNALRIMLNLDEHELELSRPDWLLYMKDPFRWFVRAPTPEAERIWALIEARQRAAVPDRHESRQQRRLGPSIVFHPGEQRRRRWP